MGHYIHGNDEGKQAAQLKRIKKREGLITRRD